ncbi:MAG: Bug family tripartite tricarboxylate transporter substrate binding protein [Xanthobacteraceae bacterium]
MTDRTRVRRAWRTTLAIACLASAVAAPASAQDWPARNVTVIVPLGAGSASDIMARVVADQLTRQLKRTVVVENRPGAGGTIGAGVVARSAPDGYTVLAYGALGTAHALYSKLPYNTLTDFTPVIAFGQQPLAITTSPAKGYKTLGDMIAKGKANPGSLNFSSAGVGSASHFAAERLLVTAGIKAQHIPTKGAAESLTEIMSGRVDFSVQTFTTTLPLIRDGKLLALAVSAHKRVSDMPNVPTTIEAGLPAGSVYPFYSGFFVPAKTPRAVVEKLHAEAGKALQASAVKDRLSKLGVESMPMTLEQFLKFFKEDVDAAVQLVKAANIKRR